MSLYYQTYNGSLTGVKNAYYNFLTSNGCTIETGSAAWDALTINGKTCGDLYNNISGTATYPFLFMLCDTENYEFTTCLRSNYLPTSFSLNWSPTIIDISSASGNLVSFKTNSAYSNWLSSYFSDRQQQISISNYQLINLITLNTSNYVQRIAKDLFVNVNNLNANALQVFYDGEDYYIYCGCNVFYKPAKSDYETVEEIKLLSV